MSKQDKTRSFKIVVKEGQGFRIPGTKIRLEAGDEMIVSGPVEYQQPNADDAVQQYIIAACEKGMSREEIVQELIASFSMTQTDAEVAFEKFGACAESEEPEEPEEPPEEPEE